MACKSVGGRYFENLGKFGLGKLVLQVDGLYLEWHSKARLCMACKAVGGHYLENTTKLCVGQLLPGPLGSFWNN